MLWVSTVTRPHGGTFMRVSRILLWLMLVVAAGCDRDTMSERGFSLPDGDAMAGR